MSYKYRQGIFKPKNPEKYVGNVKNIVYRSSLEFKFMLWADNNSSVIKWNSEELVVKYVSPKDNKIHRYFIDMLIQVKNDDKIETIAVEIKPESQTKIPFNTDKKKPKTYINEVMTYGINQAKWAAATKFCEANGWKFQIITEKNLT